MACLIYLYSYYSSDIYQREEEKARLEKAYKESDRELDKLLAGVLALYTGTHLTNVKLSLWDY